MSICPRCGGGVSIARLRDGFSHCERCSDVLWPKAALPGIGVFETDDQWLPAWYAHLKTEKERRPDSTDFKAGWDAGRAGSVFIPLDELEAVETFLRVRKGMRELSR